MRGRVDPLWTTEDLAEHLGIPERTLRQWRYLGEGPPWLKLGGHHVRYDPGAVAAWKAECVMRPRSA